MFIWEEFCEKPNEMTFMRQNPDWTFPDSLNMELYYKDHLHLIENGNIKFSEIIIETLQYVLSPQWSSQLSSSCLSQSSLIISPPPSSSLHVPYPGPSVKTLSQSPSSQSLSATVTQTRNIKVFCLILRLLHQNFKHYLHHHPSAKCFLYRSRQLLTICRLLNQLCSYLHQTLYLLHLKLRSHLS